MRQFRSKFHKTILLLAGLSFLFIGCSTKKNNIETKIKNSGITNGTYTEQHPNGTIKFEAPVKDSQANGLTKSYYENGNVNAIRNFVDGSVDGEYQVFYESGELYLSGQAKNGKKVGTWKSYYKSGNLLEEAHYTEDGNHGKNYYEDGTLKADFNWIYGKSIEIKKYDKTGNLIK